MPAAARPPEEKTPPDVSAEAPLTPSKSFLIAVGIAGVLLLAYLFCAVALVFVSAMVLVNIVLVIPALRVGMAEYFAAAVAKQGVLAGLLVRGLRLQESMELSVPLERSEAPGLMEMLEELAQKVGVPPPSEVRLMMPLNAWVRVRGYRSGRTGSVVGIGFDLIAACSVAQMRAILAHELAHAKLIQPGFKGWLNNAMVRISQVGSAVGALEENAREQRQTFLTATLIHSALKAYARVGNRLIALHSRQHEFGADRLAAEVAGAGAVRDGLLHVHIVEQAMGGLDHRQRLIQSQRAESFTAWLQSRMAVKPEDLPTFTEKALSGSTQDPFDSHPALADRLRALPEPDGPMPPSQPATSLLAEPDAVAARLLAEMERMLSEEERKENLELLKAARKNTPKPGITALQWLIILCVAVVSAFALISAIITVAERSVIGLIFTLLLFGVIGIAVWLYPKGRRKEKGFLPSPAYSVLTACLEDGPLCRTPRAAAEWRSAAVAKYPPYSPPGLAGRRAQAAWWGERCFEALGMADYSRAYACAFHALNLNRNEFTALVTMPIVASAVGDQPEMLASLDHLFRRFGLGPSLSWCSGWCFALQGEWATAEAYLHDAAARRPADPSVWALLGYCQWHREKIRESVTSLRRAIYLRPDDPAQQLLLARILLDSGRPREADEILSRLDPNAAQSREALVARTRLHLLLGQTDRAVEFAEQLTSRNTSTRCWLDLGRAYYEASCLDLAENALLRVRELGFYPEALVTLAGVKQEAGDKTAARTLLLEAIDTTRKADEDAISPQDMLKVVCRLLMTLGEPVRCHAWTARLNVAGLGFDAEGLMLVVLATGSDHAAALVQEIWAALHGGRTPPPPMIAWQLLPKESQPDDPLPPGIYGVELVQGISLNAWR